MSKLKNILRFDKIEQKLVFRVSRTFFWIFVTIAGLSFVAAVFVLLYSIIPPGKEDVVKEQYPSKPKVTLEEVMAAINPPPPVQKYEEKDTQVPQPPKQEETKYEERADTLQLKINKLIDSLGTFVKSGWGTTYENYIAGYDWFNNPVYETRAKRGLRSNFENILSEFFESKQEKITTLEFLIQVMQKVGEDKCENALRYFMRSTKDKWTHYREAVNKIESDFNLGIATAEAEYANAKLEKIDLSNKALMSIGSAIVLIALVGLILCFLAIERNTRAVKELLEREKKSEIK